MRVMCDIQNECTRFYVQYFSMTVEVLYYSKYGGFELSRDFMRDLFKMYPADGELFGSGRTDTNKYGDWKPLCDGYQYTYCTSYTTIIRKNDSDTTWFLCGYSTTSDFRSDPRVVALFKERKDKEDPAIRIRKVPAGCNIEITEYDGLETVNWDVPKEDMLNDVRRFMDDPTCELNPITKEWLDSKQSFTTFYYNFIREKNELCGPYSDSD